MTLWMDLNTWRMDESETMQVQSPAPQIDNQVTRYRLVCGVVERLSVENVREVFDRGEFSVAWTEVS